METHVMIAELKRVAKKYEGKKLHTFEVDINAMCLEVAERLEELSKPKLPTYEEVIAAWETIDYSVSRDFEDEKEITSVMENGSGELKHFSFIFQTSVVAFGQFVYDLTTEELNAINLTIKYLESLNIHD